MADDLNPAAESRKARPVYLYDVPASMDAHVKQVGLVMLTADDELQAWRRSNGENAKLAMELAKAALCEGDGKRITLADGSADVFWRDMEAPLRNLVMEAYADLHAAKEDEKRLFLGSRKVRVA